MSGLGAVVWGVSIALHTAQILDDVGAEELVGDSN